MAQTVRFAIIIAALLLGAFVFERLASHWAWFAAAVIVLAGAVLSEAAFKRLASPREIQRDLANRLRNPPP